MPESQAEAYKIKIGYNPVAGTQQTQEKQQDWWKWFTCAALGVLLVEWYIYNKRVYISVLSIAGNDRPSDATHRPS